MTAELRPIDHSGHVPDDDTYDDAICCRWLVLVFEHDGRNYRCSGPVWRESGLCEPHAQYVIASGTAGDDR